jgi:hypothetical protein
MYGQKHGVSHCSVVKPYYKNDNERFSGQVNIKPAPILINEQPEWEVETVLNHRKRYGGDHPLVK